MHTPYDHRASEESAAANKCAAQEICRNNVLMHGLPLQSVSCCCRSRSNSEFDHSHCSCAVLILTRVVSQLESCQSRLQDKSQDVGESDAGCSGVLRFRRPRAGPHTDVESQTGPNEAMASLARDVASFLHSAFKLGLVPTATFRAMMQHAACTIKARKFTCLHLHQQT